MFTLFALVGFNCQISDESDLSSRSVHWSSSSAKSYLREALAHACLAAELSELY